LTNDVSRSLPLHRTTELATKEVKLEPPTVRVKAGPPTVATFGERPLIVGMGLGPPLILKFTEFELPPPSAGFVTNTCALTAVATAAASTDAVRLVELTNVVVRAVPPNVINEAGTKFVPLTVSVKAAPPATALFGEIRAIVGTGLPPLMVKFTEFEVPPPGAGLVTLTGAVPVVAMAAAGMVTINSVELTNVMVSAVLPNRTIEAETKFVPFTVSVNAAPPAMALVGEIVATAGDPLGDGLLDEEGELLNDGFEVHPARNMINANVAMLFTGISVLTSRVEAL
jgi:hypothetical protein